MTSSQPMPIRMNAASGLPFGMRIATMTGGAQATNGPKNGIAMRTPDAAAVTPMYGIPRIQLVTTATAA